MWTKSGKWVDSPCEYHIPDSIVEHELKIWKSKRKRKEEVGEGKEMYKMNMIIIDAIIKDLELRMIQIKKRKSYSDTSRKRLYNSKRKESNYYL